jgi:hypothetical protein
VCLSKPEVLAYYEICHFSLNYRIIMFYSTGPGHFSIENIFPLLQNKLP